MSANLGPAWSSVRTAGRVLAAITAAALVPAAGGCALMASASAAHSHITPCVRDPTFATIDLLLGSGAGLVVVATGELDRAPVWLTVPGALLASGVIGTIYAYRCRDADPPAHDDDPAPRVAAPPAPPGTAPDLIAAPDTAPAALGLPAPVPPAPAVQLRLPADYQLPDPPRREADHEADHEIDCGGAPPTPCPPGQSCLLVDERHGRCVADP